MNCQCCNQESNARKIIKHTQGNRISIRIPLTQVTAMRLDGDTSFVESESALSGVIAFFTRGKKRYEPFSTVVNGNIVTITDDGNLPVGTYGIEVEFSTFQIRENKYRYKINAVLRIVDTAEEGGEYDTNDVNVVANYPKVNNREVAIVVGENDVTISEGSFYSGDQDASDNYADVNAEYGDKGITIEDDYVTLNI